MLGGNTTNYYIQDVQGPFIIYDQYGNPIGANTYITVHSANYTTFDSPPIQFSIGSQSATGYPAFHQLITSQSSTVTPNGAGATYFTEYDITGDGGNYGPVTPNIVLNSAEVESLFETGTLDYSVQTVAGYGGPPGFADFTGFDINVTAVPEPGSWALLLIGTAGVGAILRRRRVMLAV